jgi:Ni,Fe-hydrogenase III small subunit
MITDVVFRSLRSRSRLIPVEELLNSCAGSRMPEVVPGLLTSPIALRLADICPTGAITTKSSNSRGLAFGLDYGKCIGCGRCVEAGEGALREARRLARCGVSRQELVRIWHVKPEVTEEEQVAPNAVRSQIFSLLGKALNIRQLDPGSCNGCEAEITALSNPYYDLERFGIQFVASPKHADMLLATGPVTRNMARAALNTYEAMPTPKLVVAVGACGCSAGIFNPKERDQHNRSLAGLPETATIQVQDGTFTSNEDIVGPVDSVLPVDAYIPGCPPTPAMLVTGILEVLRRCRRS